MKTKISLRLRIFFFMILLTVTTSILILAATYIQYYSLGDDYNERRLIRKETQVKNHLNYIFNRDSLYHAVDVQKELNYDDFNAIAQIHKVEFSLYHLDGDPLFFSYMLPADAVSAESLEKEKLKALFQEKSKRLALQNENEKGKFQSSLSVLMDDKGEPHLLLYFPYFEDVAFNTSELNTFLYRLYQIYGVMLFVAILLAFFLAQFMTRPLETIRARMDQTGILKGNEKIKIVHASKEVDSLVNSYNSMVDALEESVAKLAKSEREQAWQEMAKQVAHEIKNPLTPMRLTVQSFQQRFDPHDEEAQDRLNDFSKILIEQIDTMSKVATAFSDFATLPQPKIEDQDLVSITQRSTEIFAPEMVKFKSELTELIWPIDRTQWIRMMTNLIQNAIQAVPENRTPEVHVHLVPNEDGVEVWVRDNGSGIEKENLEKIFEPKFTTKTGGMGLGLGIVKNIIQSFGGELDYTSEVNKGTTFKIKLKKNAL